LVKPGQGAGRPAAAGSRPSTDARGPSWWTARATSEVTPGFTREAILAEIPPDPSAPGGLFERVGGVLDQLSQAIVAG
jgi:hypothetical protein